jgi:lipoyl-dependent peroxiredoxin
MPRLDQVLYTASTHTTGGREGVACSSDGRLEVQLSTPGGPGRGTNPEQLFAAGWSACFMSAIRIAAAGMKLRLPQELSVDAEVDLGKSKDGFALAARLSVSIPGVDREVAEQLLQAAHATCPYSRAVHGNIDVDLRLA